MKKEQNENCHRGGQQSSNNKNAVEVPILPPMPLNDAIPDEVPRRDGPGGEGK